MSKNIQIVRSLALGNLLGRISERNPNLGRLRKRKTRVWKLKTGRHHSDNRVVLIVQLETLAYSGCFAAEVALPKSIAQHNHHVVPGFRFIGGDTSAQLRLRTQHRKQIRRHARAHDTFGLID